MLYLTGCRTAFVPLALVVPVFFICYGERKWILLSIGLILAGIIAVSLIPDLIPRLSDISTLESRFDIWYGAFQGIAMYPLFGNGPQTYGRLYPIYDWHKAPHAHNIYIVCNFILWNHRYSFIGWLLCVFGQRNDAG